MDFKEMYASVTGIKNYSGNKVFKVGSIIKLIKEPDNDHDTEAIICEIKYIGKVGYIANSTRTVIKGTMSAGRLYDKISDVSFAKIRFIGDNSAIAKILTDEEIEKFKQNYEDDDFYNGE